MRTTNVTMAGTDVGVPHDLVWQAIAWLAERWRLPADVAATALGDIGAEITVDVGELARLVVGTNPEAAG